MCVLYVSFESKERARTFECVAMCSAVLFILRSILLVYSAGYGVNRVQVILRSRLLVYSAGYGENRVGVILFCP